MATMRIERVDAKLYVFKLSAEAEAVLRNTSEELYRRGLAADDAWQFDDALDFYRRSIDLNPRATGALVNLGTIFYRRRDWKNAEQYYRQALEVDPQYPLAHFNLGNLFDELGCFEEAVGHYEKALEFSPDYADAHFNLALVCQKTGRGSGALRHWHAYLKCGTADSAFWREFAVRHLTCLKDELPIRVVPMVP